MTNLGRNHKCSQRFILNGKKKKDKAQTDFMGEVLQNIKETYLSDLPGSPVVKTSLLMQGVPVRFLVRELRSHIPYGQKAKNIEQEQYFNKFNKDFKNGPLKNHVKNYNKN